MMHKLYGWKMKHKVYSHTIIIIIIAVIMILIIITNSYNN